MSVKQRVARGAKWLDKNRPGWVSKVKLNSLDMSQSCLCVLGQVFEQEGEAAKVLSDDAADDGYSFGRALLMLSGRGDTAYGDTAYGFDALGGRESDYNALRDEWKGVIRERKRKKVAA